MASSLPFVLFGLDRDDRKVYYTGRAGDGWVSTDPKEAFTYETYAHANGRARVFNQWTDLHGIHFIADNGA